MVMTSRCAWCGTDPVDIAYHDQEWGVPVHDDHQLFELLTLEGAQAGLSWSTILRKRDHYRAAFAGFDPVAVARFDQTQVEQLMANPGIVRNRLKITSTLNNAQALLQLQQQHGSFDHYLWEFVAGRPIINRWRQLAAVPAQTPLSQRLSKALKQQGFRFVGPTVCYAFMQAVGMVNDHTRDCFRYRELGGTV